MKLKLWAALACAVLSTVPLAAQAQPGSKSDPAGRETYDYQNDATRIVCVDPQSPLTAHFCSIGGGSLSAKASAAAPSSAEGATTDPLSMTLFRQLRVMLGAPGGGDIDLTGPGGIKGGDGSTIMGPSNPVYTSPTASSVGGCAPFYTAATASTNATNVKASSGTLCSLLLINTTSTLYYFRAYNLATSPTCSSATGWVFSVPIPASATGAGAPLPLGPAGMSFGTGLGYCITGGAAGTDNTNAAVGVYVTGSYK